MRKFLEVHYILKPGMRDAFYNKIQELGLDQASRNEAGNEKYNYYFNPHNEDELVLLEIWKSQEAVEFHNNTEHFKKLGELKKEYVADVQISRMDIIE